MDVTRQPVRARLLGVLSGNNEPCANAAQEVTDKETDMGEQEKDQNDANGKVVNRVAGNMNGIQDDRGTGAGTVVNEVGGDMNGIQCGRITGGLHF